MLEIDRLTNTPGKTSFTTKLVAMALSLITAATLAVAVASPASAATVISGEITCLNSASPVGVWVEAKSSRSGWAATKIPYVAGGQSKVTFSYTLNAGGSYRLSVGCGGTSARWGTTLLSGWLSAAKVTLKCNDIPDWLAALGRRVMRVDLTQGIPFRTCR